MAVRMCFISNETSKKLYQQKAIEFTYHSGFALSQKQKSIKSLHENIRNYDKSLNILEISTKSKNPLGINLSAFNLKYYDNTAQKYYNIENVFQSSKVFRLGGPYKDLLDVSPKDAKRDERLKTSGQLQYFEHNGVRWESVPRTMFYDYIYISSLSRYDELTDNIMEYNAFTDIEFNHNKSINCQARAAAIFVSLRKRGLLQRALDDIEFFQSTY